MNSEWSLDELYKGFDDPKFVSDFAKVDTKPQLEIYADDVVCSHGATIGSLSEDELFYMRSRGIPEAEARQMQIQSFLSPVLSRLE